MSILFETAYQEKAFIIHPVVQQGRGRDADCVIEEATGLARAINLDVLDVQIFNVGRIQPGHFLGKGQREQVAEQIKNLEPDILIFNHNLSPVQQRNLEKEWLCKVIDRTGLILEIFGARAQTAEGRLQVELAAMDYQRSRLVRSWTHLERQRGGAGFMGGPGETQIELDRRIISDRIVKLKKELESVRRTRELGRKSRERTPFPTISLVGYTNAGKSTLFNRLTGADVFAEDLPFATLDPTLRRLEMPNGQTAILSDTVGFISDLPTHLIAAFRATLEQITFADVIVHVIDCSREDYHFQRNDVIGILTDLGIVYDADPRIMEVYNKADLLPEDIFADLSRKAKFDEKIVLLSALTGQGIQDLLQAATDVLNRARIVKTYTIPHEDGKAIAWLYEHGEVLNRHDGAEKAKIKVALSPVDSNRFIDKFGYNKK